MKKINFNARQAADRLRNMTRSPVTNDDMKHLIPDHPGSTFTPGDLRAAHALLMPDRAPHLASTPTLAREGQRPPFVVCHYKKGGVGKTTTMVNVAICMAEQGYRVLFIDADPQGTATSLFNVDSEDPSIRTIQHLIFGFNGPIKPEQAVIRLYENAVLDLIPSDITLAEFERAAFMQMQRELLVEKLLTMHAPFFAGYDIILVDTNPGSNQLNFSLLVPADFVVIPVSLDVPSMKSMRLMNSEAYDLVEIGARPKDHLMVANAFHAGHAHSRDSLDRMRKQYAEMVADTVIPSYTGVSKQGWTSAQGMALVEREPTCQAAKKFGELAVELAEKMIWAPLGLPRSQTHKPRLAA